ncbi:MAG: MFS transporter [Planctomycetota bacterium]
MNAAPPAVDADSQSDSRRPVWLVSLAVLLASSTWFAGTAVAPQLAASWSLDSTRAASLTSATQFGFLVGTVLFAVLNLADRFRARAVFAGAALAGALANAGFAAASGLESAVPLRFLTGITLAGVYPVGMKIVASFSTHGLGLRLGIMVGALGVGTALPFLVQWSAVGLPWRAVVAFASVAASAGAALVWLALEDGPHLRTRARFDASAAFRVFHDPAFRLNACGYFGHMWELYTVWSLQVFFLRQALPWAAPHAPLLAFGVVAIGALGCVGGGLLARRLGERTVALRALVASTLACLLSPWAFTLPAWALIPFMLVWGLVIVADSPQFSALAARLSPPEYVGTALTVQNGLGFALTVVSIQCVAWLGETLGWRYVFLFLAPGPALGAWSMRRLGKVLAQRGGGWL